MRIEVEYLDGEVRILLTKPGEQKSFRRALPEAKAKAFFHHAALGLTEALKKVQIR